MSGPTDPVVLATMSDNTRSTCRKQNTTQAELLSQQVCQSLKEAYTTARQTISITQRRQKECKDRTATASQLQIGDRVWLYVPAVKTGRNRKLSSLWRGPYTIIGKTSPVNYRIQLIGSTKCLVVHRNRLKLCYGEPRGRATPRSAVSEGGRPRSTPCSNAMNSDSASWVSQLQRTYADVVTGSPGVAGYTTRSKRTKTITLIQRHAI